MTQQGDGFKVSTFSGGGNCVAVRVDAAGEVTVRRSTGLSPELLFSANEWQAFLHGVKAGEFDSE